VPLRRSTWIALGVYALVAVVHAAFVRAPGPALVAVAVEPWAAAPLAFARLEDGAVLASGTGPEGPVLWYMDGETVARIGEDAGAMLAAPSIPARGPVRQVVRRADGAIEWVEDGAEGAAWTSWRPPEAPRSAALPAGTLWVTRAGRPVQAGELPPTVGASVGAPALLAGGWALLSAAAGDDVVIAPRDEPAAAVRVDTSMRRFVAALPRDGEFALAHGLESWLSRIRCGDGGCAESYEEKAPSTGGPAIVAVDLDPVARDMVVCTAAGELLRYAYSPGEDVTELLGAAALPGRCDAALALPGGLALARVDGRWWRVRFARRGGLLL
jgi:hypothetical protein